MYICIALRLVYAFEKDHGFRGGKTLNGNLALRSYSFCGIRIFSLYPALSRMF